MKTYKHLKDYIVIIDDEKVHTDDIFGQIFKSGILCYANAKDFLKDLTTSVSEFDNISIFDECHSILFENAMDLLNYQDIQLNTLEDIQRFREYESLVQKQDGWLSKFQSLDNLANRLFQMYYTYKVITGEFTNYKNFNGFILDSTSNIAKTRFVDGEYTYKDKAIFGIRFETRWNEKVIAEYLNKDEKEHLKSIRKIRNKEFTLDVRDEHLILCECYTILAGFRLANAIKEMKGNKKLEAGDLLVIEKDTFNKFLQANKDRINSAVPTNPSIEKDDEWREQYDIDTELKVVDKVRIDNNTKIIIRNKPKNLKTGNIIFGHKILSIESSKILNITSILLEGDLREDAIQY